MNTFKRYRFEINVNIILIFFLLGGAISCTKNFEDINSDPYSLTTDKVTGQLLGQAFAQCQYHGIFGLGVVWQQAQNLYADLYSQYFATSAPYFSSDQFIEINRWSDYTWRKLYGTAAPQFYFVEQFTEDNEMVIENAIAKVWKVELYHRISDYWGPCIFTQFGNGETSVAYDSQKDIYLNFFKILDNATSMLKQHVGETSIFSDNDLVFNGNVEKWLTFANSLRLRLAIRISYVDPVLAQKEAENAVNDGVMMNSLDNAYVATTQITQNPHGQVISWDEFRMSAAMESTLKGYKDPRLKVYFSEADNGGYHGLRNGLPVSEKTSDLTDAFSRMGIQYFLPEEGGSNLPIRVMCAEEVYFLRAEGALRGWEMGGTAKDLYEEGIRTSLMSRTNATAEAIQNYIDSNNTPTELNDKWDTPAMSNIPVRYESSESFETKLEQLITQKWIALYPDGWEAWSERRRTGYPKGYPLIESLNPDIPITGTMRRLVFTLSEIQNNQKAVDAARMLLGGQDVNQTRLWWDAKP